MSREKRLEKLVVELEAKTAKYKADLDKAQKRSKRWAKSTKKDIIDIRSAFGLLGAGYAVKSIIDKTAQQEKAFKQLEQGIKSTSAAAGFGAKELASYASSLQGVTTFGDEDIIQAMSQLVTFTSITGDEFKRTTEAALDLATRMDMDVKSAVLQLGKALNDPISNLSALSRAGIQFSDDQKQVIKALVEGGRQAEAQRVILAELEKQFGGSAKAARDTFGGSIEALNNAFGDLLESDSGLNAAKQSIEELTTTLSDPSVKQGVQELTGAIISGFAGAAAFIANVTNAVKFLAEEFAAWVHGPAIGDLVRLNEELAEVEAKILAIGDANSRSNAGERQLQILQTRKKTLEQLIALSNQLPENSRTHTISGGDVSINGGGEDDGMNFMPGMNDHPMPQEGFFEEWGNRYTELGQVAGAAADQVRNSWLDALDSATVSMSRMMATGIVEGEKLEDVFENIGKAIATELLASLIQVGIQMLINKALGTAAKTAEVAESAATGTAIATAYAPAAALASLATLGSNAIPASMGISSTVALSHGLAGMAHDGISEVPREGTWLLDKGERVLSAKQNSDLKSFMNGGGAQVTNVFQVSTGVAGTVQAEIMKALPAIQKMTVQSVEGALRSGGSMSKAAGVR